MNTTVRFALGCVLLASGCYDFDSLSLRFVPATNDGSMYPAHCHDGILSGDESDADCGGSCKPCTVGQRCVFARDCHDLVCSNNVCDQSTCSDMVKNGNESDVDCGGVCSGCAIGKKCNFAFDCTSMTCVNGVCAPGQCVNGKKDGAETDIDCGGGTCGKCSDGKMCLVPGDCNSAMCVNNVCKSSCPSGTSDCDANPDCETQIANDPKNCGKCGMVCPLGTPVCFAGGCVSKTRVLAGSYMLTQGPPPSKNLPSVSCVEACAMLFGGMWFDYFCSTQGMIVDHRAYLDGYQDPSHCQANPLAEDFKMGANYNCGVAGCAYSALVNDHIECANSVNWCFK